MRFKRITAVVVALALMEVGSSRAGVTNVTGGGPVYATIAAAVTAAAPGDTLLVLPGTYTLTNSVILNKSRLTLRGASTAESSIEIPRTPSFAALIINNASNVTVESLQIRLTGAGNGQELISINRPANGIVIRNNLIWGGYDIATNGGVVSVGVGLGYTGNGGITNFSLIGNIFHSIRQPARMHGVHADGTGYLTTGQVISNHVSNSKGFTIWGGGNVKWQGNTFGSGGTNKCGTFLGSGDQVNIGDIAILPSCSSNYFTDIAGLSEANNHCVVEDQRVAPYLLSVVYVDPASTGGTGVRYDPYRTLTQAVDRAAAGGIIRAFSGLYTNDFIVFKRLTFELTSSVPVAAFTMTAGTPAPGYVFRGWKGDIERCTATGNSLTVVMDSARRITAAFELLRKESVCIRLE